MALPPSFLEELRARTPMNTLVGRRVKLSKSGRNWKGCCPFHNEKSPSFYVYEDGFHCFGCGAHGDAITFVMQTGGGSFIDAVESLAGEAGLEVPKQSPREAERELERLGLHAVLDLAQAEFVRLLRAKEGAAGLAYLRERGLSDATIEKFGLGWSGDGRGGLTAMLARNGVEKPLMEEAGLLRPAADGQPARELYWNRVTFPIRDRRGRLISFGGRTLGDGKPKYINGPETPLYQKKHHLFAHDLAREGVRKGPPGGTLVVVEGYMDVIALHAAGYGAAVAPLGTALTAEQMELLWRMSPAPVLCFDGDEAGRRAAARAAELCLPLVTPERTLRFARLPAGKDPDDLTRGGDGAAFVPVLEAARPLAPTLFELLGEGVAAGPEGRAQFRARLDEAAARITDRNLQAEYRGALRDMFFEQSRAARDRRGRPGAPGPGPVRPRRPPPEPTGNGEERARLLTALLLRHPVLLRDTEEAYAGLDLPPSLAALREAMLDIPDHAALDSSALLAHLTASGFTGAVSAVLSRDMPLTEGVRPDAMPAEAEKQWWHFFGLSCGLARLDAEIAEAQAAMARDLNHATAGRLKGLVTARQELVELDDDI